MDKKILDELNKQDWVKIRKTLISYVIVKLKYNQVTSNNADVIHFVDNIIGNTFLEERKWNPSKVSLHYFLRRSIDSEISNFFKKKATILSSPQDIYDNVIADRMPDDSLNLEDNFLSVEAQQEKIKSIRKKLSTDDDAGLVFEYLLEGCSYEEIKEQLGIDKNQLNNVLKRLRRKTLQ